MSKISLTINGRTIAAEQGRPLLEVARENGIPIPTLCHMEGLKPYGACRLCLVEIVRGETTKAVASCLYEATDGLVVQTESPRLLRMRRLIAELLYPAVQGLPADLRVTASRFDDREAQDGGAPDAEAGSPEAPADCTLCGRCVRYCSEVRKKDKVYFAGRGIHREVSFDECLGSDCPDFQACSVTCGSGRMVKRMVDYWGGN